ncbi:hypothetical protein RLF53_02895, partial [Streptococcus pneumoniae]|nr:hypothetical protein [Streptococcus pneumoniae]
AKKEKEAAKEVDDASLAVQKAHVEYRKVLDSRNSYRNPSDHAKKLAEADKKITEETTKLTNAQTKFQSIRTTIVVPEQSELAETKKKAEEAKAEEKVAKR